MIFTGHNASNHGGLVIYLKKKWEYRLNSDVTKLKLWERQIIEIFDPNETQRNKLVIGNIYRLSISNHIPERILLITKPEPEPKPPYNSRDLLDTYDGVQ